MQDIVISKKFLDLLSREDSHGPRATWTSAEGAAMVGLISAHFTRAERTGHRTVTTGTLRLAAR